jgi:hypothetical protein
MFDNYPIDRALVDGVLLLATYFLNLHKFLTKQYYSNNIKNSYNSPIDSQMTTIKNEFKYIFLKNSQRCRHDITYSFNKIN